MGNLNQANVNFTKMSHKFNSKLGIKLTSKITAITLKELILIFIFIYTSNLIDLFIDPSLNQYQLIILTTIDSNYESK